MRIPAKVSKKLVGMVIKTRKFILNDSVMTVSGENPVASIPDQWDLSFAFLVRAVSFFNLLVTFR